MTGDALREAGGGLASLPVPISTPGYDAAPYLGPQKLAIDVDEIAVAGGLAGVPINLGCRTSFLARRTLFRPQPLDRVHTL
jgi:hypothetical protein